MSLIVVEIRSCHAIVVVVSNPAFSIQSMPISFFYAGGLAAVAAR